MGSATQTLERILNPALSPPPAPPAPTMTLPFSASSGAAGKLNIEGLEKMMIGTASDITPLNPGSFQPINPINYQDMLGDPNNRWDGSVADSLEELALLYQNQAEAIERGCEAAVTIAEQHTHGVVNIVNARSKIASSHLKRNQALAAGVKHQLGLAPEYQTLGLELAHTVGRTQHQMRLNLAHYVGVLQEAMPQ